LITDKDRKGEKMAEHDGNFKGVGWGWPKSEPICFTNTHRTPDPPHLTARDTVSRGTNHAPQQLLLQTPPRLPHYNHTIGEKGRVTTPVASIPAKWRSETCSET